MGVGLNFFCSSLILPSVLVLVEYGVLEERGIMDGLGYWDSVFLSFLLFVFLLCNNTRDWIGKGYFGEKINGQHTSETGLGRYGK